MRPAPTASYLSWKSIKTREAFGDMLLHVEWRSPAYATVLHNGVMLHHRQAFTGPAREFIRARARARHPPSTAAPANSAKYRG